MGKVDPEVIDNLHIANVGPGIDITTLYAEIKNEAIETDSNQILIILDSINRIVDFSSQADSDSGYWSKLSEWSSWAMNSRRTTDGRISWLIVSELNNQGQVKGRNLEYISDMVIRMSATSVDDVVEIDIPYSRATKSSRIGPIYRDYPKGRFLTHD